MYCSCWIYRQPTVTMKLLYALICDEIYKKSKRYEDESIRGDQGGECWNWSPPVGPTANWSLDLAPWSGAQPKTRLVGPRRAAYKEEVGTDGSSYEVHHGCYCSPPQTLIWSERVGCSGGKHHRHRLLYHAGISSTTPSLDRRRHCTDRRRQRADPHHRTRDAGSSSSGREGFSSVPLSVFLFS